MKNKLVTIIILASVSSMGAVTIPPSTLPTWSIKATVFSFNDKLINNIKNIQLGYKGSLTYHVTPNLYGTISMAMFNHGKFGYGGLVGAEQKLGMFRPYAELGYEKTFNDKDQKQLSFTYDAGTNIVITPSITSYVEFDNFVSHGKEAMTVGTDYALTHYLKVGASFQYVDKNHDNNASAYVGYSF